MVWQYIYFEIMLDIKVTFITEDTGTHASHFNTIIFTPLSNYCKHNVSLLCEKEWSYQVPILHMSWQLSCHDMCKFGTL